jgi:hypothetical protein
MGAQGKPSRSARRQHSPAVSRSATTKPPGASTVAVAERLRQPLEDLARAWGRSPARIVNLALTEYLERWSRPDLEISGSTSSYIEMTVREDRHDIL